MHLSYVFYIFVSAFIFVQCTENDNYHNYTEISTCDDRQRLNEIKFNMKNVILKPRKMHVTLKPKLGWEFQPAAVYVNQCNGHCRSRWSPMPTRSKMKTFTVHMRRTGITNMASKCVSVHVQEHTDCKCMCAMTDEDCEDKKRLDKSNCNCVCKERDINKLQCENSKRGMEWHDSDCSCQCTSKIMDCTSGMKWSKELCDCIYEWRHRGY